MYETLRLTPGPRCPGLVWTGEVPVNCGLNWPHLDDCVPFIPGDYLIPPTIHPLDAWIAKQTGRCPCGCYAYSIDYTGPHTYTIFSEPMRATVVIIGEQWEILPCGHRWRTPVS